jgi:hypothetical protein
MNNTTSTEYLISILHDKCLDQEQTLEAYCIADIVMDVERSERVEFTPSEIIEASRDAGERFVDSMIQNEYDTQESEYDDIAPLEERVARWEAMRPSIVRRKAIMEALSHEVRLSRRAFEDIASRYSDDLHGQDGEEEVYEAARSMFDSERDYIRQTDPDRYSEMLRGA